MATQRTFERPTGSAAGTSEMSPLVDYWNAANYLTVAQIYLQDNTLLREPLAVEHIKPRLLGHWGTSPGLNLVYAHLNRLISATGAQVLSVARGEVEGEAELRAHCARMLAEHDVYIREHFEDMPEVRDWTWTTS